LFLHDLIVPIVKTCFALPELAARATSLPMCGRYTHKLSWQQIVELYRLTLPEQQPAEFRESFNVAPTDVMPIIRPAGNGRELIMARWGLVPFWSKPEQAAKPSYSTINARSDRIQTAAAYREAFKTRRCLIPTTGWYEWQKIDAKAKRPHHFQPKAMPFAFGGVYDIWKGGGKGISSFSIVTTAAAPSTAEYHDRMPLVLEEGQFEDWMRELLALAAKMMKPYAGAMEVWQVPADVGNVRNNRPDLMQPVAANSGRRISRSPSTLPLPAPSGGASYCR
jgi:putative SOS response-associated peptidase YedK